MKEFKAKTILVWPMAIYMASIFCFSSIRRVINISYTIATFLETTSIVKQQIHFHVPSKPPFWNFPGIEKENEFEVITKEKNKKHSFTNSSNGLHL